MATQEQQIEQSINRILKDKGFSEGDHTRESDLFNDLGMDSLDFVEFVMDVEKEFNMTIPDEDMEGKSKVGDVISYINNSLESRK